jgi:hypothetical protein
MDPRIRHPVSNEDLIFWGFHSRLTALSTASGVLSAFMTISHARNGGDAWQGVTLAAEKTRQKE